MRVGRLRLILAVVCLAAALIAVGVVYVPAAWLAQAGAALQVAGTYLLSFGGRSWLFAAGGVLVVCALLLIVLPRRRPHPYWVGRPSAIASVSVYVDAENEATSPKYVRTLVQEVRNFLGELRKEHHDAWADLIYFTDSTRVANAALEKRKDKKDKKAQERWMAYRTLYQFGFRPVHVAHGFVGSRPAENVVDVELALYAYQRALLGPPHQTIILVANDGDYYPLIYRLRALEHTVHVWGTSLAEGYTDLEESLGIEVRDYSASGVSPSKANEKAPAVSADPRPVLQLSPVNPIVVATLSEAIAKTLSILEEVSEPSQTAAQRFEIMKRRCSGKNDIPYQMGITSTTRLIVWLWLLTALGVLIGNITAEPFKAGPETALSAARKLERLLDETSAMAREMASATAGDQTVGLSALWQRLCQNTRASSEIYLTDVRAAMGAVARADIQHYALTLCRCARTVGLLRFKEVVGGIIQVTGDDQPARNADANVEELGS